MRRFIPCLVLAACTSPPSDGPNPGAPPAPGTGVDGFVVAALGEAAAFGEGPGVEGRIVRVTPIETLGPSDPVEGRTDASGYFRIDTTDGLLRVELDDRSASALVTVIAGQVTRVEERCAVDRTAAFELVRGLGFPATALIRETQSTVAPGTPIRSMRQGELEPADGPLDQDPVLVAQERSWLFYADLDPFALHGHEEAYALVGCTTGSVLHVRDQLRHPIAGETPLYYESTEGRAPQPSGGDLTFTWAEDVVQTPAIDEGTAGAAADSVDEAHDALRLRASQANAPSDIVAVVFDAASREWRGTASTSVAFIDFLRSAGVPASQIFDVDTMTSDAYAGRKFLHVDVLERANAKIAERLAAGKRSTLIVYYAGHSEFDTGKKLFPKSIYFGLRFQYRGTRNQPDGVGVRQHANQWAEPIQRTKACRVIIILETCFAARMRSELNAFLVPAPYDLTIFASSGADTTTKGRVFGGVYHYTSKFLRLATILGADIVFTPAGLSELEDASFPSVGFLNGGPSHTYATASDADGDGCPDACDDPVDGIGDTDAGVPEDGLPDAGVEPSPDAGDTMTVDAGDTMTVDAGDTMTVDAGDTMTVDAGAMTTDAGPMDAGPSSTDSGVGSGDAGVDQRAVMTDPVDVDPINGDPGIDMVRVTSGRTPNGFIWVRMEMAGPWPPSTSFWSWFALVELGDANGGSATAVRQFHMGAFQDFASGVPQGSVTITNEPNGVLFMFAAPPPNVTLIGPQSGIQKQPPPSGVFVADQLNPALTPLGGTSIP
jgi:hypothetical protein